jgi:hypothetical protein
MQSYKKLKENACHDDNILNNPHKVLKEDIDNVNSLELFSALDIKCSEWFLELKGEEIYAHQYIKPLKKIEKLVRAKKEESNKKYIDLFNLHKRNLCSDKKKLDLNVSLLEVMHMYKGFDMFFKIDDVTCDKYNVELEEETKDIIFY